MTRSASVLAPAKVNLFLRVLGRREDGFHEIRTVFQSIDFGDMVGVSIGGSEITLEVDGPDLGPLEENLAHRAAVDFAAAAGLKEGISVRLEKKTPAGAGLGGGSSDAAAVLRLLNHLTGHVLGKSETMELGARLGSDVPFFLGDSPRAQATGRGEVVRELPALPACALRLLVPPVHVATGRAYGALGRGVFSQSGVGAGIEPSDSWSDVVAHAENDFEQVVAALHPEVEGCLAQLRAHGHDLVMLSGSGGACFALDPAGPLPLEAEVDPTGDEGWLSVSTSTLTAVPPVA